MCDATEQMYIHVRFYYLVMQSSKKKLTDKVKDLKNAVARLAHVGFPTALLFSEAGFNVTGCEMKDEFVSIIVDGRRVFDPEELRSLGFIYNGVCAGRGN
jgi:hypothetical protein